MPPPDKPQHSLGENEADILFQPLAQSIAPVGVAVGIVGLGTDPHHTVSHFNCRCGNVVGPQVEGAATRQVKTRVVPMAGQDAVFDRASM